MREIKFRGLRVDGKGWVYGSLVNNAFFNSETKESIKYIFNSEECDNAYGWEDFDDDYGYYQVSPETVGQFTGLKDRNGNDIYEGDKTKEGVIIYENGCFMLFLTDKYEPFKDMKQRLYFTHSNQEIIGNIHQQK